MGFTATASYLTEVEKAMREAI